jgi:glycosyltransferase involved in cell wall biosynthesis
MEVIIVDDASTDASLDVARHLSRQFANVRVIANEHNQGHVATFNNGLAVATGDYVVRLDADDLLTPGCLTRAVDLFDTYPSVGLVYGRPHHFTSSEPPTPIAGPAKWTVWSGHDWIRERCRRGVNCITTPEAVIRGSVFRSIGPLSPKLRFAQDMEIWLRAAAISDVGYISGPDQALHRDHAASMSATIGSSILTDLVERRAVFDILFDGPGHHLVDAKAQHELAHRTLACEALRYVCHSYDRGRVSSVDVQGLLNFALDTYPSVNKKRYWRSVMRRRMVGPRLARVNPVFVAQAGARRIDGELAYARWLSAGT